MSGKICAMYFSPTHTSQKITLAVADAVAEKLHLETQTIDLTLPAGRKDGHTFGPDDVLVFGFPVYGGRMPMPLVDVLLQLYGDNTAAIPIAVYGNRDYEDALLEAADLLSAQGFQTVAAGAFLGEHSHSLNKLAANRPDADDLASARQFGAQAGDKLATGKRGTVAVKGNTPYRDHMSPLPFLPKTTDSCTGCKICVQGCPMGIIDADDPHSTHGACLTCFACVKSCPVQAKYFDDAPLLQTTAMLEEKYAVRKEPECFV